MGLALCGSCGGSGGGAESPSADFTLHVAAAVSGPQDSRGRLRVRIERNADFTDAVDIDVMNPPPGVDANAVSELGDEAWLPLHVSAEVALGAIDLTIVGRSAGKSTTARVRFDVRSSQPRAQELIQAALAAGQIDLGTSLLYRAYAVFGDTRLPADLVGSGPLEEDGGLFMDIEQARPTLPASILDELQPFLLRPDDPLSYFNVAAATAAAGSTGSALTLRSSALGDNAAHCTGNKREWITDRSAVYPVRAWALCLGNHAGDEEAANDLFKILDVVDKAYGKMVESMGPAKPDLYGDEAIDVYVVPPGADPPRGGGDYEVEGVRGVTVPQPPYDSRTSSAYVMLPTWRLALADYDLTVIHELFHVLQDPHNAYLRDWFVEASATWASLHYNRIVAIRPDDNLGLHQERFGAFQKSYEGLRSLAGDHAYHAYIWPFFMEQEASDGAIADAWIRFETVGTDADRAASELNGVLPFADNFHLFTMRNINEPLVPGDPLPKRYHDLDPAFPDQALLPRYEPVSLAGDGPFMDSVNIGALAARYFRFVVVPDTGIQSVDFDLSQLDGVAHANIDAFIHTTEGWVEKFVPLDGELRPRFCFDRGPSMATLRGSFDELRLVISNHDFDAGSKVSGNLVVRPSKYGCASWEGEVRWTIPVDDGFETVEQSTVANVAFVPDPDPPGGPIPDAVAYKIRSGTLSYHIEYTSSGGDVSCHGVGMGTVTMVPDTMSGDGATIASLFTFSTNGKPQYGYITAATYTTTSATLTCSDGTTLDNTVPNNLVPWWNPIGTAYDLKENGTLMEESTTCGGGNIGTCNWSLHRIDN